MQAKRANLGRFSIALVSLLVVAGGLSGRPKNPAESTRMNRHASAAARAAVQRAATGAPQDWSHRHLIFSNPGSEQNAIRYRRHDAWEKITNDPRYIIQQKLRRSGSKAPADGERSVFKLRGGRWALPKIGRERRTPMHRDWGVGVGSGSPSAVSYPAKWSFDFDSASCADDFVVYPTGAAGSGSQPSIVSYFNVYSGCTAPVPTVDFAYNTGGTITGATSFSVDGTQLAFIQTSAGVASLVLLKIEAPPGTGTLTTPITLTPVSASAYTTCTAPCMTTFTLSGSHNDSLSNPWVDYSSDTLFVGDNSGALHEFSPVFNGTTGNPPAENLTNWPVALSGKVGSPVFDPSTNLVFVGTSSGVFYAVGGGVDDDPTTVSGQIYGASSPLGPATPSTSEIVDAPIVDGTAGMAYVFVQEDSAGNNAVFQFPTNFTSGTGNEQEVGAFGGTGAEFFLSGTFDNIYFSSEDLCTSTCSPSGNLYVGGNTEGPATLYQIPITSNVMGTPNTGPGLETTSLGPLQGRTSPVTEFFNSNGIAATGTISIVEDPAEWTTGGPRSVTVGGITYTFVFGAPGASTATDVQVAINNLTTPENNQNNTAGNLQSAIAANPMNCDPSPCFGTGTVANTVVTATINGATDIVNLTATQGGASGDFTVTESGSGINDSSGNNGASADFIFFSSYTGNNSGTCPSGCVFSFNVSSGGALAPGTTPAAMLGVTANLASADGFVTGGIIIDNEELSSSPTGTSQIYFLSLDNEAGVTCSTSGSAICATQASQSGLN